MSTLTVVHLLRHGEVDNPRAILYGRLPGYHLSPRGQQMAEMVAEKLAGRDIAAVISSPLERARETAAPLAARFAVTVAIDERLLEAGNVFQGLTFGVGEGSIRHPRYWRHLYNPFRPSWGEPYKAIARRMVGAVRAARDTARGREAVCVSHQLPIWMVRSVVERRRLWHDPRRRHCSLASLTSLTFSDDKLVALSYAEPAASLLPVKPVGGLGAGT
jgi:broad specificity phosphatase PhoE